MVLHVLDFFLPLVQTSVVSIFFQQGRENVVKETGFSKVSISIGMELKRNLKECLIFSWSSGDTDWEKKHLLSPNALECEKRTELPRQGNLESARSELLPRTRPASGDFMMVTLMCDSGSLFQFAYWAFLFTRMFTAWGFQQKQSLMSEKHRKVNITVGKEGIGNLSREIVITHGWEFVFLLHFYCTASWS